MPNNIKKCRRFNFFSSINASLYDVGLDRVEERTHPSKRVAQTSSPQQRIQIAQTYRTFSQEADVKLSELIHSYNMYNSSPKQVVSGGIKSDQAQLQLSIKWEI